MCQSWPAVVQKNVSRSVPPILWLSSDWFSLAESTILAPNQPPKVRRRGAAIIKRKILLWCEISASYYAASWSKFGIGEFVHFSSLHYLHALVYASPCAWQVHVQVLHPAPQLRNTFQEFFKGWIQVCHDWKEKTTCFFRSILHWFQSFWIAFPFLDLKAYFQTDSYMKLMLVADYKVQQTLSF